MGIQSVLHPGDGGARGQPRDEGAGHSQAALRVDSKCIVPGEFECVRCGQWLQPKAPRAHEVPQRRGSGPGDARRRISMPGQAFVQFTVDVRTRRSRQLGGGTIGQANAPDAMEGFTMSGGTLAARPITPSTVTAGVRAATRSSAVDDTPAARRGTPISVPKRRIARSRNPGVRVNRSIPQRTSERPPLRVHARVPSNTGPHPPSMYHYKLLHGIGCDARHRQRTRPMPRAFGRYANCAAQRSRNATLGGGGGVRSGVRSGIRSAIRCGIRHPFGHPVRHPVRSADAGGRAGARVDRAQSPTRSRARACGGRRPLSLPIEIGTDGDSRSPSCASPSRFSDHCGVETRRG